MIVFVSLFTCAFLWPSEGAMQGDGLHLTTLWLISLAAIVFWDVWQMSDEDDSPGVTSQTALPGNSLRSPDSLVALGTGLLLLGIWLSTWNVFRVSGDRRAALNLAFDWTAIGAAALLCRRIIRQPACRRSIVHLIAGLGIGLAVYGIWQSHSYYAAEGARYLQDRKILDNGTNPAEVARVRREFSRRQIPLEGPARRQFEQRLLSSTEPFGPFALANTLAGVLAVSSVLIGGSLLAAWRAGPRRLSSLLLPAAALAIVTWCLVMTKSRTAWVGSAAGLTVMLMAQPWADAQKPRVSFRTLLKVAGLIGGAAVGLFGVGLLTGVVDKEVILESPRSLQFRLFYWLGAAGVIADQPVMGAGPGNFRQLYLAHKPVESSESILDPHNVFLDAWCFAGIIGFAGLVLLVLSCLRSLTQRDPESSDPVTPLSVTPGLAGCLLVHFGWKWLSGEFFDSQDLFLAGAVVVAGVGTKLVSRLPWNPAAPAAAAIALLVHLTGAGGLQITTMGFLLVVLAMLASPAVPSAADSVTPGGSRRSLKMLAAAGIAAMAGATLAGGLLPVKSAELQQAIGRQRLLAGDSRGALQAFQKGAEADPLSPVMRQQIVQAAAYSLMQRSRPAGSEPLMIPDQELSQIDTVCRDAVHSDERAIAGRLSRARIYQQLVRLTGQSQYIETSVSDLRDVIRRHPTNAALQVELAICEQTAGHSSEARTAAERALAIESVNQSWGHSDQYLSEDELTALDQIMNGGAP